MRFRRLTAAVSLAGVVVLGTGAAAFPPGPSGPIGRPEPVPALTRAALSARYAADARAVTAARSAAVRSGDTQLASALTTLRNDQVIFFDAHGQGLAGVVFGDLATATRVAIIVPGSDTSLSTFFSRGPSSPGGAAAALAREAGRLRPDDHLAVIAWLGYADPPTLSRAILTSADAASGAENLRPLVNSLAGDGKQVAVICHSYGSVVCGLAAKGLPVTDIAVVGSPGMDASSAASLDPGARVWAGRGSGDWIGDVPHVQVFGLGFGTDPMSPGFGARIFATGNGGHSDYFKPGSVSLRDLAWIALGDPSEVTR